MIHRVRNGVSFWLLFSCLFYFSVFSADDFVDTYSFDHTRYSKTMPQAIDELACLPFPLNTEIRAVVSGRPAVVKDSDGNKRVYLSGELRLMQERNGDITFFSGSQKYCKIDIQGRLLNTYGWDNKGLCAIRNSLGEVSGFEHYRFGGRIVSRFDSHMNLTNVYFYDESSAGYWDYNVVSRQWSRYELGKAAYTKSVSQDGVINSYWKEEDGCLWEVKMTAIIVRDAQGQPVLDENGQVRTQIVEGERIRYNGKDQSMPMEGYDFEGKLKISYVWDNYRLKKVSDYENGTYQTYGEFANQLIEEGTFDAQGNERITWEHVWSANRHLAAYEHIVNPLGSGTVRSGKYITYTVEGNVDAVWLKVDDTNLTWVAPVYNAVDLLPPAVGDDILLADYTYFYEVSDSAAAELSALFHADDSVGRSLYSIVQEDKSSGKAAAGLFCKVIYGMGNNQMQFFNEFNHQDLALSANDRDFASFEAGLLSRQANSYLEYGDYAAALKLCNEFSALYGEEIESEGIDTPLGELYLKVQNVEAQAREKVGR